MNNSQKIERIIREACTYYGVKPEALLHGRRKSNQKVSIVKQVVCYLIVKHVAGNCYRKFIKRLGYSRSSQGVVTHNYNLTVGLMEVSVPFCEEIADIEDAIEVESWPRQMTIFKK